MLEYWHVAPCFQTRVSKSPLPNVKTHLLNESIQKIHAKNALQKTQYNEQISGYKQRTELRGPRDTHFKWTTKQRYLILKITKKRNHFKGFKNKKN